MLARLTYISREGKLPIEAEDDMRVQGKEGLADVWAMMADGGQPIPADDWSNPDQPGRKEALHLVLSMPAGTDPDGVLRAAREFAKGEFGGRNSYAMVLHTFETDPDPQPSKSPHVHLIVKMRGFDGARLNPRKADVQAWRRSFAEALRANGIEATATSRRSRLQRAPTQPQWQRHAGPLKPTRSRFPRGPARHKRDLSEAEKVERRDAWEQRELADYAKTVAVLVKVRNKLRESTPDDRALGLELERKLLDLVPAPQLVRMRRGLGEPEQGTTVTLERKPRKGPTRTR